MQRRLAWLLLGLLCIGGLAYYWHEGERKELPKIAAKKQSKSAVAQKTQTPAPFQMLSQRVAAKAAQNATNASSRFPYRLSNTTKTVGQLAKSDTGILMVNALIDTSESSKIAIPEHLRAPANNGSYIVQARGPIDNSFRIVLQAAGAEIVSYVPNNAYLVRMSDGQAGQVAGNYRVQSVLPYEPYYKIESGLMKFAVEQKPLPDGTDLKLTLFPGTRDAALEELGKLNAQILAEERSPFGPVLTVRAPANALVDVALNSKVQGVQRSYSRAPVNDLMRTTLQVSTNTVTNINYLGLTGSNVLININDTGVDQGHPDLTNRVFGDSTGIFIDTVGHGTHVAGIIAGSGVMSSTVSNVPQGSVQNADFRGMASEAKLYALSLDSSDTYLQEQAAKTNAFISNNSWGYVNAFEYNIEAASYDAAVRDALPSNGGPQPVLFVFSAGNNGAGEDLGLNGDVDSILSPGTAKNVITVGALEEKRNITNDVYFNGETNKWFQGITDSRDEVAGFSSRGNVGVGLEGDFGRFKPDVVAPGSFIISTRSSQWDTNAYYHPTNHQFNFIPGQTVDPGSLTTLPPIFIPDNAVGLNIRVFPNRLSPSPFPDVPLYLKYSGVPGFVNFVASNSVSLPLDFPLNNGGVLFYSVGNPGSETLNFNVETELLSTNDYGTYYDTLRELNDNLGPYYRYESGTSMAAPGISGMLGLMQEFFEQRMHMTNSPALMKALLINGARSAGSLYDSQVRNSINYQGWGLANLTNSIPQGLTNFVGQSGSISNSPVLIFDQSPTNALATGDRKTRNIRLTAQAAARPLRVTLVWTDPPGNPNVGIKLVNDLDLIVTNLDTGEVYLGNDIGSGADFNQSWDTKTAPNRDFVNNVENVYLAPPLGTNFSITVLGRRVNVNAVTGNTNDIVQDYALVVSCGNGDVTNALTYAETPKQANFTTNVTTVTNGVPLFNQRVGGNSQYAPTTDGTRGQWNFYIFTNTNNYTNVAFVTFLPPEIGMTRIGTHESDTENSGRAEADIDMYVSQDPSLTNLNPAALNAAYKSSDRTGTEKVLLSNSSLNQTYYIGIKSEDQQGAEYSFLAVASLLPFNQRDDNGNIIVTMLTSFPVDIPDGSPGKPGHATIIGVTTEPDKVRRVIVTNSVTHQNFGDTLGTVSHGRKLAALNNHTYFDNPADASQKYVYDDSGQNDIPGARHTDGPGSLQDFIGDKAASGVWIFTMVDDALTQTGRVDFAGITLEPQSPTNNITVKLGAHSYWYDFIDVPPNATNLTVNVSFQGPAPAGVEVMIRRGALPTRTVYDKKKTILPPGGDLSMTVYDSPPLNPGRYYIAIYNPNDVTVTFNFSKTLEYDVNPIKPYRFLSVGEEPILDDAVTYSTIPVGIHSHVVSAEVGVHIQHPRISDLVLTLISPQGTRVLLAENRGQLSTNGFGQGVDVTNYFPTLSAGDFNANTNVITLPPGQTSGSLIIGYDFFGISDTMHVYYDGVRVFDSGATSFSGNFVVDFGPGLDDKIYIVMNEGGNLDTNSAWNYTVTEITRGTVYATFTEDTNYTTLPIKFAVPPFGTTSTVVTATISGFEGAFLGDFTAPSLVDGWNVLTQRVTALSGIADSGNNSLALRNGQISRTLPTSAGLTYNVQFAYRRAAALDPIHWWTGDNNTTDVIGGADGTWLAGAGYATGEVNSAFSFVGPGYIQVSAATNLDVGSGAGFTIDCWINPANVLTEQPLVEWNNGTATGANFWIAMNLAGGGSGSLSANLVDTTGAIHLIASPPNVLTNNGYQHVALTYDKATGVAKLYRNGAVLTTAIVGSFTPQTSYDLYFGKRIAGAPAGTMFQGQMDEIGLYDHALSDAEIKDLFAAGSLGRCGTLTPPTVCPPVQANVLLDGNIVTTLTAGSTNWSTYGQSFSASTNGTQLEIDSVNCPSGMLLDSFVLASPTGSNYFLPEEGLDKLVGENSFGEWKLEILDNRAGATNPLPTLVKWQLSMILDSVNPLAIPLTHGSPQTNTVNPNQIISFAVDVPNWASFATNILNVFSGSSVELWFNQDAQPTGSRPGDVLLFGGTGQQTIGITNLPAPVLIPGQRYYLGVKNTGGNPVNFGIEVDFDIIPLTNAIPLTNTLASVGQPRYYSYDVSTNAVVTSFQLLNLSGNVDLVARKGVPLPDEISYDYISANLGATPETIVISSNSLPVVLSPGRWYLGVFNNDVLPVNYTILATEAGLPTIIDLANGVPFDYQSVPGPAMNTFFRFRIDPTNATPAVLFELYNLAGNVDLTLQSNAPPYAAPFVGTSVNPGTNTEQIVIRSNTFGALISGDWYLGVPNNEITNVTFTIRAVVSTNGMLQSAIPVTVGITTPPFGSTTGPTLTWPAVDGETYQILTSTDLVTWNLLTTVAANGNLATYSDPVPITGIPVLFYRIVQVPGP